MIKKPVKDKKKSEEVSFQVEADNAVFKPQTIPMDVVSHRKFKGYCAMEGTTMKDELFRMMKKHQIENGY